MDDDHEDDQGDRSCPHIDHDCDLHLDRSSDFMLRVAFPFMFTVQTPYDYIDDDHD